MKKKNPEAMTEFNFDPDTSTDKLNACIKKNRKKTNTNKKTA